MMNLRPRCGHQAALDAVPDFPGRGTHLGKGARARRDVVARWGVRHRVVAGIIGARVAARASVASAASPADQQREQHPGTKGGADECPRVALELHAPIGGIANSCLELLKITSQPLAGGADFTLYRSWVFGHDISSLTDSTVCLTDCTVFFGATFRCRSRRCPASSRPPAMSMTTPKVISVASHAARNWDSTRTMTARSKPKPKSAITAPDASRLPDFAALAASVRSSAFARRISARMMSSTLPMTSDTTVETARSLLAMMRILSLCCGMRVR